MLFRYFRTAIFVGIVSSLSIDCSNSDQNYQTLTEIDLSLELLKNLTYAKIDDCIGLFSTVYNTTESDELDKYEQVCTRLAKEYPNPKFKEAVILDKNIRRMLKNESAFDLHPKPDERKLRPPHPIPRKGRKKCIRKEYRTLTEEERFDFHRALNRLKFEMYNEKRTYYDYLSYLHTNGTSPEGHFSCAFLPFHREYMFMVENLLRHLSESESFCLPYWDSSIDMVLFDPCHSSMWVNELVGPSYGDVTEGPFANWTAIDPDLVLYRECDRENMDGRTDLWEAAQRVKKFEEFCFCYKEEFELAHARIHALIGGDFNDVDTSIYDPVVFMHHTNIDRIWEIFRREKQTLDQRQNEYPEKTCGSYMLSPWHVRRIDDMHEPLRPFGHYDAAGHVLGMRLRDGLWDGYTDHYYTYSPTPTCQSGTCNGKFLICDPVKNACMPTIKLGGNCTDFRHIENVCYEGTCIREKGSLIFTCSYS